MADYHKIHSKIWTDSWFYELDIYQQHLFIYLFSNGRANIAGIYELPLPVMAAEVKMTPEQIRCCFEVYEAAGKAYYKDGVVWVKNLRQYHETPSPQLQKGIRRELEAVKECALKQQYFAYYGEAAPAEPEAPEPVDELESAREDDSLSELPFDGTSDEIDGIDRVCIGSGDSPSLVLSKSSVVTARARSDPPPFVTAVTQRMQAIFDVCGLDPAVPAHRQAVEGAAAQLDSYSADEIRNRYERPRGPIRGWNWYLHDFRGRKGDQPTPRWVVENISKQVPVPVANGNGHDPWAVIERAWKEGNARVVSEDARVFETVERMGGWLRFKNASQRDVPFLKQEFLKVYNASIPA